MAIEDETQVNTEAPLAERRARLLELLDQVDKQSPLVASASAAFWAAVERHRQAQHSDDAAQLREAEAHVDECRTRAAREDAKMTQLLDRLRAEHCAVK